jgi:hypothetical protein
MRTMAIPPPMGFEARKIRANFARFCGPDFPRFLDWLRRTSAQNSVALQDALCGKARKIGRGIAADCRAAPGARGARRLPLFDRRGQRSVEFPKCIATPRRQAGVRRAEFVYVGEFGGAIGGAST